MSKRTNSATGTALARVAVIGGGFGGIAAGVTLKKAGFENFIIYEKSDGLGGTWWENRYPGAEVDTPSHLYSFSFAPWNWSRTHARQPELQEYTQSVIRMFGLREHFVLNTRVTSIHWNGDKHTYTVRQESGLEEVFDFVISAVGFLNEPLVPAIPGSTDFPGAAFHSSYWPADLEVAGLRVGVVGTGSTAVQIVSETAKTAASVTVFQRHPNWILPKHDRHFSERERHDLGHPLRHTMKRLGLFLESESGRIGGRQAKAGSKRNNRDHATARAHLHNTLGSRPDLIQKLEPDYAFAGKRPVINDTFYPSLLRPNVHLVPHALTSLTTEGGVDASGDPHPLDVVVYATGFKAANYLGRMQVGSSAGPSLQDHWKGDPSAFLGITVPGFPNFFMLYGPNTNAGPVIFFLEKQAAYAVKAIRDTLRKGKTAVDTRSRWHELYNSLLQRRLKKTVWAATHNYYKSASGRIVTQWPSTAIFYWLLCAILRKPASTYLSLDSSSSPVDERGQSEDRLPTNHSNPSISTEPEAH